ncbi:MAG: hypothetical protein MJZ05_06525 [Fibrobacter sp.]|nr:hypothetical protein [Fibrobacter sp.]
MIKKLLLTVCLTAFLAWAQDDEDDDEGFISAPAAAEQSADDDDEWASAPSGGSRASIDDEESVDESAEEFASETGLSAAQRKEQLERKKFEEEQRQDEYANSLRRRDWLRNRLMLQIGMGSRYSFMGESGMGMSFGIGAEYIFPEILIPVHFGVYGSVGFLPKGTDSDFEEFTLEGGSGYKVGINMYLFPKNPLHLGLSLSYGTVYFDHDIIPDEATKVRPLIAVNGYQADLLISYLTNEWYYLQFSIGMYYAPILEKTGAENPSFREKANSDSDLEVTYVSRVVNPNGMSKTGIVFGIAIGYALPELFPDDTEKRRREREKARARSGAAGR